MTARDNHGNEIKVGDRVRRVVMSDWPRQYGAFDEVYTVLSVTDTGTICVINGAPGASAGAFKKEPDNVIARDKNGNELQVGDRVRRVDDSFTYNNKYGVVGEVYTVLGVEPGTIVIIKGNPGATSRCFELVKEADMTAETKLLEQEVASLEARLDELNERRATIRTALTQAVSDMEGIATNIEGKGTATTRRQSVEAIRKLKDRLDRLEAYV
jgi:uncharacterized Zn ribbon protein